MRSFFKLLFRIVALTLGVATLLTGFVMTIPDGNDYVLATRDKHARLREAGPGKLVLVGGSNLAFGVDSSALEHELGSEPVNMGMNAFLGLTFMLNEIKTDLQPGDLVVLSLEHACFFLTGEFDPVDGKGSDLLMMVKSRPAALAHLRFPRQHWDVIWAIPHAAQQKTLRLIEEVPHHLRGTVRPVPLILQIETRAGFNDYGDLVSHLDEEWPDALKDGPELRGRPFDARVLRVLAEFYNDCISRGVDVVFIPPPTPASSFVKHGTEIVRIYHELRAAGLHVAAPPERYVFDDRLFFDDISHLDAEGRSLRTRFLAEDLRRARPERFSAETTLTRH